MIPRTYCFGAHCRTNSAKLLVLSRLRVKPPFVVGCGEQEPFITTSHAVLIRGAWSWVSGTDAGGCQNYGPLLGPYYNTAPII